MIGNLTILLFLSITSNIVAQVEQKDSILFTCIVSQTSTTCDAYTINILKNRTLSIIFGEKEFNGDNYIHILDQKNIPLDKKDFKRLKALEIKTRKIEESKIRCSERGGWQIDIISNGKKFNFCNGEQIDTPLGQLYDEIKRLSPIEIELHWGGCPN
jgi:hypothetical protein